ncbi:AAA family ATPase [Cellvibrio sp. KY-YJ-3]|uniref:AAA family ATPase n=1 Tax=Cellvibrio sp. KY-YJ-3 TaxID=454662 RepID=UPI0012447913|nr:AAA family ATPase [Cellvibrio sp. KY-YJ-3]QEY11891.1 AAA family ATPase [Cellvibrio sp. KY-YJ-3]
MAKKSANKNGTQHSQSGTFPSSGSQRTSPEKLVPVWSASFENASKIYQSFDMTLDIKVNQEWLNVVLQRFQAEEAAEVESWIERFAEVCKELGKFREKLQEEYSERWDAANRLGKENEAKEKEIAAKFAEYEAARSNLESGKADLTQEEQRLSQKNSELLERERALKLREINADAGFAIQNQLALSQLEEHQRQLLKQHEILLAQLQEEKHNLSDELRQAAKRLAEIKYNCTEEEAERIKQLEQREDEINQDKIELDRARSRLDREWSDFKRTEDDFDKRISFEIGRERESHIQELAKIERQRDDAWRKVEELKEELADTQELKQVFGERSASDIIQELESLRSENRTHQRTLDQSDTARLQQENEYLLKSKADLERDISVLLPELDEARRELSIKRVAATELECVAREKRVLEQHKNTLAVHIDDLESRIDQLTNSQKTQTPFPAMSLMDSEKEFRTSIELEDVPDLVQFSSELQNRIARAEKHVELFYSLKDIRILLGGLAMSQLHVFQGISGTGKTSLAKAFAKAMGGFCTDISVQAGWRDRDDLLGHYNAFERRFYEKDCLQALYKAQTSRWQDTCNIILLDEMNLSRPEQYFAEFLSALEKNNKDERLISLSETTLPNAPSMFKDGRKILVPENIWFIGTANHDETTNELADKTYDRAHVMTLPKQDERFQTTSSDPKSYSYLSLRKAFDQARSTHKTEVQELLDKLSKDAFTEQLGTQFSLGWGNRFEKQALDFIPVMLAAGATNGEALDHLLSTRIMRSGKVTGRYNVAVDAVRTLKDTLENYWVTCNLKGDPVNSLALLNGDIQRLEGLR